MMGKIVDGKSIAAEIRIDLAQRVRESGKAPVLGILIATDDPVIDSFVRVKKRFAEAVGAQIEEVRLPAAADTDAAIAAVNKLTESADGIVVQLPLPERIDKQRVLDAVPQEKDIDVLSQAAFSVFENGAGNILPPVAGSIAAILAHENIELSGLHALVIGRGQLVGAPAAAWLRQQGADVETVGNELTCEELAEKARHAGVLVSGAGVPGLITPEMVKPGAILLDAGTATSRGSVVGDIDPKCAEHAKLAALVPGGIGPVTVAVLFQNLLHASHA